MFLSLTRPLFAAVVAAALLLTAGCGAKPAPTPAAKPPAQPAPSDTAVEIPHVHGMSFTADGKLLVAAHGVVRQYADGKWSVPPVAQNDYMGFSPTADGFYSSGHPGEGSKLPNPIGLVKSTDGGKTLTILGFAGQADFHYMGVGYRSKAIYVLNDQKNATLDKGFYSSQDDGKTWKRAAMKGVAEEPFGVVVHPTDGQVVGMPTEKGFFLSSDGGNAFAKVGPDSPITAAAYNASGETLLLGFQTLYAYDSTGREGTQIKVPELGSGDAIGFIAINPSRPGEIAFATYGKEIYITLNEGKEWKLIAEQGKGK